MREAAIHQVLRGQAGDRRVVAVDLRKAEPPNLIVQVHGRARRTAGAGGRFWGRSAGDDPVAVPALQPRRRRVLQGALLDVDGPWPVFAHDIARCRSSMARP